MISRRRLLAKTLTVTALQTVDKIASADEDFDPTRYVDPRIGTGGHGHTFPGATVPFGMVQLSPDTYNVGWDWCSGYYTTDTSIMGFSHTHLSGTGIGDMLDILVMPGTGVARTRPGSREKPEEGYRSRFSHDDERIEPGYYSVVLRDYDMKAELTATERAGLHRYTFPVSESSHFIVDLEHAIRGENGPPAILGTELKLVGGDTLVGGRQTDIWAKGRRIYFALKFSKPFLRAELVSGEETLGANHREARGRALKCLAYFQTTQGEVVHVKIGLSGVSVEGALKNLDHEIPGWDFDGVRAAARLAWRRELSRIKVTTANQKHKQIFYTAMYHAMLAPTLFDDVDGNYRGLDGKVHQLSVGSHNYSTYSLWDTYRALHPLFTLMQRERVPAFVNCLIRMANESPNGMPVWPLQGAETGCMTGYHSAVVIAEAAKKGFAIDLAAVYPALMRRAMQDDYRGLEDYRQLGYIPCDRVEESATKTLEYAYDDWAAAHIAEQLDHDEDYQKLRKRSANYRNLLDTKTGFVRPRLASGEWAEPFDPKRTGTSEKWRDFTESNSWQATWAAQHDPQGYVKLMGGREMVTRKLDALFEQSSEVDGEVPADMTGLVGMYAHGNEPSHHIAYLYCYFGQPWKTQARVRSLLEQQYKSGPDGLAGNEDCGQMSAWYIISALGFYAVDAVSGNFVFGTPLFEKAVVDLGGGKKLTIVAKRQSPEHSYIQAITFNGLPYRKTWFTYASVSEGGEFVIELGPKPNTHFGAETSDAPPSMTDPY